VSYSKPVRVWCGCGRSAEREVDRAAPEGWEEPVAGIFHCCSAECRERREAEVRK